LHQRVLLARAREMSAQQTTGVQRRLLDEKDFGKHPQGQDPATSSSAARLESADILDVWSYRCIRVNALIWGGLRKVGNG
ncbi:MAG TPA: hypothetical protein PL001_07330, partial [Candidatus Kryptobacter bacterium]|nr:hypothetical protein [Candidatus Kryptobacter bacterium]